MFSIFKKWFDFNERELKRLREITAQVNAHEDAMRVIEDSAFSRKTEEYRARLADGSGSFDDILPEAYALVREAGRRTLGLRQYDVQIMAAIALHEGKITEQKTGEGKTLAATSALYLNALTGKGAHLVTVNDYLARRDAGWNGALYHLLGLTTSAIISDASFVYDPTFIDKQAVDPRLMHLRPISRKEAYAADITYGINSEFGFDYLRDNMIFNSSQRTQRDFHYAIIDEADSVLIDEARTPHIISAPYDEDTSKYYQFAKLVNQLNPETDYIIDEKLNTANLTDAGISTMEKLLGVSNIYEKEFDSIYHMEAALRARSLYHREKEYIVRDGEVIIVDEFTGRLLPGRRFSEGLHQAIEAKEGVPIQRESKTMATVSLQNYFRMYEKLAGMTGTAATEAEEFHKIYNTDVIVIPTHRKNVRIDHPDMIYKTERAKFQAVVEDIIGQYRQGRPVLLGTTSIEKNEHVSHLLTQKGIPHEVLNAKNHQQEAQIIARAGEKGAITVATNMAGRGVDIILGGTPPQKSKEGEKKSLSEADFARANEAWQRAHDEIIALGGLYVIGTERHESRRIDNQLRGRSGRQGDPGETRFYVALEDDLMRIFGGEQIGNLMNFLKFPEDQPLSHAMVTRAIEQAQVKVEGHNFDTRKHLVEYDDVLNKQREIIYTLRNSIVEEPETSPDSFMKTIFGMVTEQITQMTQGYATLSAELTSQDRLQLANDLFILFPDHREEIVRKLEKEKPDSVREYLLDIANESLLKKEKEFGRSVWFDAVRQLVLSTIDQYWTEHLTSIEDLREGINLRGYAQLDPLVEYKNEAFSLFERLLSSIDFEASRRLLRAEIAVRPQMPKTHSIPLQFQAASGTSAFSAQDTRSQQSLSSQATPSRNTGLVPKKIGRNEPCWCGSGKKFKKCHGSPTGK